MHLMLRSWINAEKFKKKREFVLIVTYLLSIVIFKTSYTHEHDTLQYSGFTGNAYDRNVFEQKKKKPGLSADRPSNNCAL